MTRRRRGLADETRLRRGQVSCDAGHIATRVEHVNVDVEAATQAPAR